MQEIVVIRFRVR